MAESGQFLFNSLFRARVYSFFGLAIYKLVILLTLEQLRISNTRYLKILSICMSLKAGLILREFSNIKHGVINP